MHRQKSLKQSRIAVTFSFDWFAQFRHLRRVPIWSAIVWQLICLSHRIIQTLNSDIIQSNGNHLNLVSNWNFWLWRIGNVGLENLEITFEQAYLQGLQAWLLILPHIFQMVIFVTGELVPVDPQNCCFMNAFDKQEEIGLAKVDDWSRHMTTLFLFWRPKIQWLMVMHPQNNVTSWCADILVAPFANCICKC